MATGSVFKRRAVPAAEVAAAETAAAAAPITGDPRAPAAAKDVPPLQAPNYAVGQVYDVPLERVRPNPVNPRAVYTSLAVDDMAVSLAKSGQLVAATGFSDGGYVVLIEGETRLRGARAAGLPTLRIEIKHKPASDLELYKSARAANVERRDQTPLDDALKWKELLDRKIFANQASLSRDLDIPESTVSRTLALAAMPQRIIMSLSDHASLLNFQMLNAIREYVQAYGEERALDFIPQIDKNGWGYRRVADEAMNAKKAPVQRKRGDKEPIEYAGGKGEIKIFEGGKRLEISLKGITDPQKANAFVDRLKALTSE